MIIINLKNEKLYPVYTFDVRSKVWSLSLYIYIYIFKEKNPQFSHTLLNVRARAQLTRCVVTVDSRPRRTVPGGKWCLPFHSAPP